MIWCGGFACGAIATLIVVTIVSWIVDESHEMQHFDDTQARIRSQQR